MLDLLISVLRSKRRTRLHDCLHGAVSLLIRGE